MELLIAILTWLGLITSGTTYTDADVKRIAIENRTAVVGKINESNVARGQDPLIEEVILYK